MTEDLREFSFEKASEKVTPLKRSRVRTSQSPKKSSVRPKSLETEIGALLTTFNFAFYFLPDKWSQDALDAAEIEVLAKQINLVALDNPIVYKYLSWAFQSGGSTFNLVLLAAIIGGRRMARHGYIPEEWDAKLAPMLGTLGASQAAVQESLNETDNRDYNPETTD